MEIRLEILINICWIQICNILIGSKLVHVHACQFVNNCRESVFDEIGDFVYALIFGRWNLTLIRYFSLGHNDVFPALKNNIGHRQKSSVWSTLTTFGNKCHRVDALLKYLLFYVMNCIGKSLCYCTMLMHNAKA